MSWLDRVFAAAYERGATAADRAGLGDRRRDVLAAARGHVVEIGAGVGSNLAYLGDAVTRVTLLEPSAPMARRLRRAVARTEVAFPVEVIEAPAEAIPLPDASADTVLSTFVLCTVDDPDLALAEVRRILRPGGQLLVAEHVVADGVGAVGQRVVEPVWRTLGRGCHLTRDTGEALRRAGFDVSGVRRTRLAGAGPASPAIEGAARRPPGPADPPAA